MTVATKIISLYIGNQTQLIFKVAAAATTNMTRSLAFQTSSAEASPSQLSYSIEWPCYGLRISMHYCPEGLKTIQIECSKDDKTWRPVLYKCQISFSLASLVQVTYWRTERSWTGWWGTGYWWTLRRRIQRRRTGWLQTEKAVPELSL